MTGKEIKEFRTRHNLTQKFLAESIQVKRNYLSMIENGKKKISKRMNEKLLAIQAWYEPFEFEAKIDYFAVSFKNKTMKQS